MNTGLSTRHPDNRPLRINNVNKASIFAGVPNQSTTYYSSGAAQDSQTSTGSPDPIDAVDDHKEAMEDYEIEGGVGKTSQDTGFYTTGTFNIGGQLNHQWS